MNAESQTQRSPETPGEADKAVIAARGNLEELSSPNGTGNTVNEHTEPVEERPKGLQLGKTLKEWRKWRRMYGVSDHGIRPSGRLRKGSVRWIQLKIIDAVMDRITRELKHHNLDQEAVQALVDQTIDAVISENRATLDIPENYKDDSFFSEHVIEGVLSDTRTCLVFE